MKRCEPLVTLVEDDATLERDAIVILDGNDVVVWRGYIDDPGLRVILQKAAKVRMSPEQAARQVALAISRGESPIIVED